MANLLSSFKRVVKFETHDEVKEFFDLMVDNGVIDDNEISGQFEGVFDVFYDDETDEETVEVNIQLPLGEYYVNFQNVLDRFGEYPVRFFHHLELDDPFTVKDIKRINEITPKRMKWGKLLDSIRDMEDGRKPRKEKVMSRRREIIANFYKYENEIRTLLGEI